ncbi:PREDICTED: salicylate carboxymethyltransferase [Nelumbo nucifera]|uniref:Salicylate carboxymethyltransferase n=1 Tax=Nelumbo nucifera TaxID=4432 RepID=A0A1U7ZN87_NELNU|nr:PREDICTED: salicylate carboxymethyltransferase [Nelumbo nucifera]
MDVEKVFHMTGGFGDTSYAANSSLQKKAFDMVKHITINTILDLYITTSTQGLAVADLGCSSGPNTLSVIREIINAVEGMRRRILRPRTEFRVFLNDLPTNDFNSVFMTLPDFYKELKNGTSDDGTPFVFISGVPGSFYGRLFPRSSLHFIHSSYSLHWLSRVPPTLYDEKGQSKNKGQIYISKASPPSVSDAYLMQFREDLSLFLKSRSEELMPGGRMVLVFLGRRGQDHLERGNAFLWELLARSLAVMVAQGEVEEEKLDSYDVHFYAASKDEIEDEVRREGSFAIDCLQMFEIEREVKHGMSYGQIVATTVRAIQESMICHHFGEGIVDRLFEIYGRMVDDEMAKEEIKPITFIAVLRKSI